MNVRSHERGQVLPIWIMGILATLALLFGALNYGNTLRWHIRAQSAADSAAQATLALQSERWNEMMELLYGLNVEEYRIRTLLNGILLASAGTGGCYYTNGTSQGSQSAANDCEAVYDILWPQYNKAVARYSAEAALLHRVASNATFANWYNDAQSLMNELQTNCNSAGETTYNAAGGDCAFQYNWTVSASSPLNGASNQVKRSQTTTGYGLGTVYAPNAEAIAIPSFGNPTTFDTENQGLFAPVQVDVITCAQIPPIVPAFFQLTNTKNQYAIGRSSATNVMFVQDWFQPGALYNPQRVAQNGQGVDFQPPENYGTPTQPTDMEHNYYAVDFGGNAGVAKESAGGFANAVQFDEMSVRLGWWNSIPVHSTNTNTGIPSTGSKCPNGGT